MSSKYFDTICAIQVIGSIYKKPELLDLEDKYKINDEDFVSDFHKIIFGSIYKLYELGSKNITIANINDFLSTRPKYEAIYEKNKGEEWLLKASESCNLEAFDYYYNRLKKFSLLRAYDNIGIDVTDIYDPDNILDIKKKQYQEDLLDNSSLEYLANLIDDKIEEVKLKYVVGDNEKAIQAGEGIDNLIDSLIENPEYGVPLYGNLINAVTRGARLNKFYLRSGASGYGKSRTMAADACYIGCEEMYSESFGWIKIGANQPVLFITTELEIDEIQTMMLAFISGVNESHILDGKYEGDEEERVRKAGQVLKKSPIYIEHLADFSIEDVENCIKKNIRENGVLYVFYDYLHSSLKILEEISKKTKGMALREDNILFMLATKLKDICNKYGVFIMSGTQLNGSWKESDTPDQNLLRGSKAIADRIDLGMHILPVDQRDLESIESILATNNFEKPNAKISVYKNRRGEHKGIYLFCKANLGMCKMQPIFATTWNYDIVNITNIKINVERQSAF